METIRRNLALADMDIRTDERGRRRIFSIKFVSKEGRVYFIPQAYACGAGRMNMDIDLILEYNKMKIVF